MEDGKFIATVNLESCRFKKHTPLCLGKEKYYIMYIGKSEINTDHIKEIIFHSFVYGAKDSKQCAWA